MTGVAARRSGLAYTVGLVAWCAASWYLSSQRDPEATVGVHLHLPDKLEHLIEYAVGGFLAAGVSVRSLRWPPWRTAVIFCGLWGVADEIHQSFVPDRDSSGMDVAADVAGASLGALAWTVRAGRRGARPAETRGEAGGPENGDDHDQARG